MSEETTRGRFVWYELLTSDPEAAQSFYGEIVGWGTSDFEAGPNYTLFTRDDAPHAGLMAMPDEVKEAGVPPHWLAYIATPDLDDTVQRAGKLGARVLKAPTEIPQVGRFAVLADPQGAAFAAFQPAGPSPSGPFRPELGDVSWHELATTDHEAAFGFYSELFDWEKTDAMDMGEMGVYQMYGQGGDSYGGMFDKPAEMPGPPAWLCYIMVEDVNETVERVKKRGGQVLNGPMEVPGGDLIVQCLDPQGAAIAFHSRAG